MMVILAVMSVGHGLAQHLRSLQSSRDSKCVELNQMVMAQVANGRIAEAEKALSAALTGGAERWADTCAAVVLGNMAAVVSYSGRLARRREVGGSIRRHPRDTAFTGPSGVVASAPGLGGRPF